MSWVSDLIATSAAYFKIGLSGVRLKNSSGNLLVRNPGDSADADATVATLHNSADSLEINSDAADSGTDRKLTLSKNPSASAALIVQFPPAKGTDNHVLRQKAGTSAGVMELELVAAGSTQACDTVDTTSLAFGSSSPVTMFTLPANAVVTKVQIIVDTAFDGTAPSVSIGVSGTTSKYFPATAVDLKTTGVYEYHPGLTADGSTNDLIATYSADGSAAGAARMLVYYSVPA